jgi:hypothetical protein
MNREKVEPKKTKTITSLTQQLFVLYYIILAAASDLFKKDQPIDYELERSITTYLMRKKSEDEPRRSGRTTQKMNREESGRN